MSNQYVRPSRSKSAIAERAALQAMSLVAVAPVAVAPVAEAVVEAAVESVIAGETFTHVGYATDKKGKGAVRYTNDKRRTRTLVRAGCTDVKFVELPVPMSKTDIDASEFIAQVMPAVLVTAVA
jgi:uncharacterized protein YbjT (DUF2867 family)